MQKLQTICFACRARLVIQIHRRARLLPEWQTAALFSSGAGSTAPSLDNGEPTRPPHETAGDDAQGSARRKITTNWQQRPRAPHRKLGPKSMKRNHERNTGTLRIFLSFLKEDARYSPWKRSPATTSLELMKALARLQFIMARGEDVATCFSYFASNVLPNAPQKWNYPQVLKQHTEALMTRVIEEKQKDFSNRSLPSLTRVSELLSDVDAFSPRKWALVILSLVQYISAISSTSDGHSTIASYETALTCKEILLQDLVNSWIFFNLRHLPAVDQNGVNRQSQGFRFPKIEQHNLKRFARNRNIVGAISSLFPQYQNEDLSEVATAAIASFVLLVDGDQSSKDIRQEARPFLAFLARILAAVPPDAAKLQSMFESRPSLFQYVWTRWRIIGPRLRDANGYGPNETATITRLNINGDSGMSNKEIHDRLGYAVKLMDADAADDLWSQFWGDSVHPSKSKLQELRTQRDMFSHFVYAYAAMRRYRRAIAAWSAMETVGLKPDIKTWTSMMQGSIRARDLTAMDKIWHKMLASDTKLDDGAWTARISGLIECRDPEGGLRALNQMARLHRASPEENVPVTIAPVNAAVSGLIRIDQPAAASNVLRWAAAQTPAIEPDIWTYNTLLRATIQQGDTRAIERILERMKEQSIKPDTITYTILLDGIVNDSHGKDPKEQREQIEGLFAEMKTAGVPANMETFARMTHLLLQEGVHTTAAVTAIRDHMKQNDLTPSPYIFTILLQYYFSQDPPDLKAVSELLEGNRLLDRQGLDRVFWEQVISGYATAGDAASAFALFEKASNLGSVFSLHTMYVLLKALIAAGELETAQVLVNMIRSQKEHLAPWAAESSRRRYWRHSFWSTAVDNGFLKPGDIPAMAHRL